MRWLHRAVLVGVLALPTCARVTGVGEDPAAVAEVTCGADATHVETASVQVQADGVHVEVDNQTERRVYVHYRIGQLERNIQDLDPGTSEAVVTDGPGTWELICSRPNQWPHPDDPREPLEVTDPEGLWVSDLPDCEHPTNSHPDYREGFEGETPSGEEGDPTDLAREDIEGAFEVRSDDVLEPAGYPEAEGFQVRLVRQGRVLAVAGYQADGQGGWIFRGVDYSEERGPGEPEPADQ